MSSFKTMRHNGAILYKMCHNLNTASASKSARSYQLKMFPPSDSCCTPERSTQGGTDSHPHNPYCPRHAYLNK